MFANGVWRQGPPPLPEALFSTAAANVGPGKIVLCGGSGITGTPDSRASTFIFEFNGLSNLNKGRWRQVMKSKVKNGSCFKYSYAAKFFLGW